MNSLKFRHKNHVSSLFQYPIFQKKKKKINKSNEKKLKKTPKKETFLKCDLDVPTKRNSGKNPTATQKKKLSFCFNVIFQLSKHHFDFQSLKSEPKKITFSALTILLVEQDTRREFTNTINQSCQQYPYHTNE